MRNLLRVEIEVTVQSEEGTKKVILSGSGTVPVFDGAAARVDVSNFNATGAVEDYVAPFDAYDDFDSPRHASRRRDACARRLRTVVVALLQQAATTVQEEAYAPSARRDVP